MSYVIQGAIVKVQGIKLAIVLVNHTITKNSKKNTDATDAYRHIFPDMPIVLLGKNSHGKSTLYGPERLVKALLKTDPRMIPWRRYIIQ